MTTLFIIGNEKISFSNKKIYHSANIDFKSIVEGLSKYFKVHLLARVSTEKQIFNIDYKKITLSKNILSYVLNIIITLKNIKKNKYLIISISPYTFVAFLILFFFSRKIYLYLRSDGFKEYESILGKRWVFLYEIMYYVMLKKSKIISCENQLSRGQDFFLVQPSELKEKWFINRNNLTPKNKIKILYVGRVRVEKGIFSMIELFSKLDNLFLLTVIGDKTINEFKKYHINFIKFFSNSDDLIKEYDKSNILILPSYTEAHPKVVDEALARFKPVIIFEDIKHIIGDREGIFVCKRNPEDLKNKILYIHKNYSKIVKKISKNTLPTKKIFIQDLIKIITYN